MKSGNETVTKAKEEVWEQDKRLGGLGANKMWGDVAMTTHRCRHNLPWIHSLCDIHPFLLKTHNQNL